jgi:HAE1 family hydrophobic/amphiphilic exporter-1
MSIPGFFIGRPITTTLITAGIILFGVVAYQSLPVSDLPTVDYPTLQVGAQLPGANPDTMASAVATPLEKQFSTIAGLESMSSSSTSGSTNISLQFSLERNIDAVAQDVQAAIARTLPLLPPNMPSPPSYQKVNPADQPIFFLSVSSPTLPLYQVDEFAETLMAEKLSTVPGVAQVQVFGTEKYAVRIQMNPDELASRGIGLDEVETAIANANVNLPTGTLFGRSQAFSVKATGQLQDAAAYKPLIVAWKNGQPVRLSDVAVVSDSVQNTKTASWFNGVRNVVLAVQRQPGSNAIDVIDGVRKLLPTFRSQIPQSVAIDVLYDRSVSIRNSVADVKKTLLITISLVILVIFLFLRNVSATLIPSLALPLAVIGTFSVMYLLGYTVDNLSLMALTLSVGFVVDDAIVMLENIVRHMEMGESRLEAALHGSREIAFTIVSMTTSLVAVFIPVLFMGGIIGRLLHEFAVTIGVAILVSGFVSLSLTPMLCSRFLRFDPHAAHGFVFRIFERGLRFITHLYETTLRLTLRLRALTMLVSFGLLALTVYLFQGMPKGFIPSEDSGFIFGFSQAAQDASFDYMERHQLELMKRVGSDPNIANWITFIGSGFGGGMNSGVFFAALKPRDERPLSADQTIQALYPKISDVPGMMAFLQNPPPITVSAQFTKGLYSLTLGGPDTKDLYHWAPILTEKMQSLPGFEAVSSDLQIASPQLTVDIDRDRARALGVTPMQIENALFSSYGNRQVSTIYAPANEYAVIAEVLPEFQNNPDALSRLYIRSTAGPLVPLSAVTKVTRTVGPLSIQHTGQLPSVGISFNLKPGVSLGDAANQVMETIHNLQMPATITADFQGTVQEFQRSFRGMTILLLVTIIVIYIVLGVLYESFIHPLTILWGLPSAIVGALLTLKLFHLELNLFGMVGLVMLFGIVKKNAIMMIDVAIHGQRERGLDPERAIFEGAMLRFRPILMTTMAALFGTLPIALGIGAGAESRQPLGLAVVGGLLVSQFLTLYITPVTYIYLEKFQGLFVKRDSVDRKFLDAPVA